VKDTEPMPTITPPAPAAPAAKRAAVFTLPRPSAGRAIASLMAVLAIAFVGWTHYEFTALRAEVREARAAAETATRAADRATLAARAAQSALASNDTPSDTSNDTTSGGADTDGSQAADSDSP
jgi:hypothetical protein